MKLALVKLGGSVITFKDRPLAANTDAIDGMTRVLARLGMPLMVVHGGGSFGHHWSVQYGMHTKPAAYDPRGVAVVHESMVALNEIIVNSMIKAGTSPYAILPSMFTNKHDAIPAKVKQLGEMSKSVVPVTFGDVVHMGGKKYSILSGDSLMSIIAKVLKPTRVIFATNADGIYRDMASKEVIKEMRPGRGDPIEFSRAKGADVTGGMQRKVREAFKIASMGMDVVLVNGLYPERIAEAARGNVPAGTVIRGRK